MQILGDLERAFASSIYPLRLPLAILAAALVVGLVVLAWRRGWLAAARRHPTRGAAVLLLALLVVVPAGWYLASPLFIRTELREAAPVIATATGADAAPVTGGGAASAPAASAAAPARTAAPATPAPAATPLAATRAPDASDVPPATPTPAPATPTATPGLLALAGEFAGADDFHFGRGRAILLETEPGRHVLRFEDFSVRNGPDLYVYLSPDPAGYADGAIELGRLRATDGDFNTAIPAGVDVSQARSVVIWCREFAVLFAVAPLKG
jgi:hypothetical protein